MLRAVRTALAVLLLALAGTASVRAADVGTIGGKLSADSHAATLTSQGTLPVSVQITVDGPLTVKPDHFTLDPGQTVKMAVSGGDRGTISARLTALTAPAGQDAASATLSVTLKPYVAPPTVPTWPLYAALAIVAAALVMRRLRPWRYRLVRA